MEVDEIQTPVCRLSRIGNARNDFSKIGHQDEDEEDGEIKGGGGSEAGRLRAWHSSRICRVSRASGGKDRHSKVLTAKGPRDRRVRLSVSTAIQFYDLQDRLGYDQPSKAVEWLIKTAAEAIAELPSLNCAFPDTPKQPSNEKRPPSAASEPRLEVELETEPNYHHHQQQQQQHLSLSKSACSSTSETSKGSVLSLSRSEKRVKARERARERAAKEKEKEKETHQQNVNHNSESPSFTDLLTGGGDRSAHNNRNSSLTLAQQTPGGGLSFVHKLARQFPSTSTPMDYFGTGLFGQSSSRTHHSTGFSGQPHFGNLPLAPPFNVTSDHHPELQQFSFLPDHLIPVATAAGSDYNLNFTISSSLAGYNRGTLQSNSSSPLPHLQRFSSPVDGSNVPFFIGTAAASAVAPVENHQFPAGFDGRLQLCYGDGCRHSDLKGKGKN